MQTPFQPRWTERFRQIQARPTDPAIVNAALVVLTLAGLAATAIPAPCSVGGSARGAEAE
jgi:hypothetical protein